jgi:hypothetical protein
MLLYNKIKNRLVALFKLSSLAALAMCFSVPLSISKIWDATLFDNKSPYHLDMFFAHLMMASLLLLASFVTTEKENRPALLDCIIRTIPLSIVLSFIISLGAIIL